MKNLYLLPTEIPGRFSLNSNGEYYLSNYSYPDSPNFKNQNIYITSDEEIKEGDWCIEFTPNNEKITELFKCNEEQVLNISTGTDYKYKKIILTTHPDLIKNGVQSIDDEFLEWFVKNPSCEEVVVEKKMLCDYCGEENCDNLRCRGYIDSVWYEIIIPKKEYIFPDIKCKCIMFEPNSFTGMCKNCGFPPKEQPKTIFENLQEYLKNTPKEKILEDWNEFQHLDEEGITVKEFLENQKQETLEQAAEKYSENWEEITGLDYENTVPSEVNKLDFINGAKWQQERMYSEEEVHEIILSYQNNVENSPNHITYNEWFEQFKKSKT